MVRAVDDGFGGGGADQRLKVPPNSIEAEQALIGGLMLNAQAWDKVADVVLAEDFYDGDQIASVWPTALRIPLMLHLSTHEYLGDIDEDAGLLRIGDEILAYCARDQSARGLLRGGKVVATVMSNLGLENALTAMDIGLVRTQVGDRYVVEAMREGGYNVGGEQSGHIVLSDTIEPPSSSNPFKPFTKPSIFIKPPMRSRRLTRPRSTLPMSKPYRWISRLPPNSRLGRGPIAPRISSHRVVGRGSGWL